MSRFANPRNILVGDFSGDSVTDFAVIEAGLIRFFISNAHGRFSAPTLALNAAYKGVKPAMLAKWITLPVGDFDGDGRTDILSSTGQQIQALFPMGGSECWELDGPMVFEECFRQAFFPFAGAYALCVCVCVCVCVCMCVCVYTHTRAYVSLLQSYQLTRFALFGRVTCRSGKRRCWFCETLHSSDGCQPRRQRRSIIIK